MRPFRLKRRTLLRGAAGIAVGLPMLEAMMPTSVRAGGASPPKRFVISWGGISLAGYGAGGMVVPSAPGPGYEITRGLLPLMELGVADAVTIVSGLLLPWEEGGVMPPAGRTPEFHYNTLGPQVAGTPTGPGRDGAPKAPTADQLVANRIAEDTLFPVLAYRVQPASYVGANEIGGDSGRMSWKDDGGGLTPVDPIVSPRLAYQSLFTGFVPPDPAEAAAAELLLRRNKSVLDIVDRHADGLLGKLGAADRIRMERHLDEIRALEERLDAMQPSINGCELLPDPGEDPPIGDAIIEYEGAGMPYSTTAGYSGEDARADLLTDFIRMAFVCDLSRVASFMQTEWKCYMNMFNFGGWESDMHELTHYAGPEESVADAVGFHLRQFGKLVAKLRDSPEVDGNTILDHSALVLVLEGGWGWDPEGGDYSTHSTENMACFVAGGAGGLRQGEHIVAPNKHPGQVVLTAMQAVGHEGGMGELTDPLPEMLA
jgi:hypothetical protein